MRTNDCSSLLGRSPHYSVPLRRCSVELFHRNPFPSLPHQVEDMLKRSFAEFHAQRSAPQVGVW